MAKNWNDGMNKEAANLFSLHIVSYILQVEGNNMSHQNFFFVK
jgi:hypothetical protein